MAFLVELNEQSQAILTAIFQACFRFWGGRFSLIVPCTDGHPHEAFRPWLQAFDPDIIYSYVDLSTEQQFRFHEDIYPAHLVRHRTFNEDFDDPRTWAPELPIKPLGIGTLLPLLARRSTFGPPAPLSLFVGLGKFRHAPFLVDNFGTEDLAVTRRLTGDLAGQAEVVAIAGEDVRPEHDRDVKERLPDELALLQRFGRGRTVTTLARLASTLTPRLDTRQFRWSESFNLVIGDTVEDRLLYWNTRGHYPQWRDGDQVDLRVPRDKIADPSFRAELIAYLKRIPEVGRENGGSGMYVTIRSASLNAAELEQVKQDLSPPKPQWIGWNVEAVSSPDGYVPKKIEDHGLRFNIGQTSGLSTGRWNSQIVATGQWHPIADPPEHLRHAPASYQSENEGLWAVDLEVERGTDNSPYSNVRDRWRWPRRLRVTSSFIRSHSLPGPFQLGLVPRVSHHNLLTLFTGGSGSLPAIAEPSDHDAVVRALVRGRDWLPFDQEDSQPAQICAHAERSDAGRYFWGVYQLLDGLQPARSFLMNSFWRGQLERFGATDQRPERRMEGLKSKLKKKMPAQPFDLSVEKDLDRLADVVLQEADAIRLSNTSISWDQFRADHDRYVDAEWEKMPGAPEDRQTAIESDRRSLRRAIQSLCERGVLHQGREFGCPRCHHRSWISIDDLARSVTCEVCKFSEPAPVDGSWDFRLNGFLKEALRRHGIGPLFWALDRLRPTMASSYWFEGPLGIYFNEESWDKGERDTDIDLTIIADGKVQMCEVKQSARGFADPEGYAATFRRLRPDIATIAIMEPVSAKITAAFAKFEAALAGSGISAELLTFNPERDIDDRAYLAELDRVIMTF